MISRMDIKELLWDRPREVLLYSCEAYRRWMVSNYSSPSAEIYAESPEAAYIGFSLVGLVAAAIPDFGGHLQLVVSAVLIVSAIATHVFMDRHWVMAAEIYRRYRPVPYIRDAFAGGSKTLVLIFLLVLARGNSVFTVCAVVGNWFLVGTLYYAALQRRRVIGSDPTDNLKEQQETTDRQTRLTK